MNATTKICGRQFHPFFSQPDVTHVCTLAAGTHPVSMCRQETHEQRRAREQAFARAATLQCSGHLSGREVLGGPASNYRNGLGNSIDSEDY